MEIFCSRPACAKPRNQFPEVDDTTLKTTSLGQLFCSHCEMPLILDGRYVIEKPLAKGGFGITYLARDRRTPGMKRCVVKQLVLQGFDPEQTIIAKELFEREGTVLDQLGNHPQIPELLAFFEIDVEGESFFYLIQEYIDGLTLEVLVRDFGPLPEADVTEILKKLLPVVQFVHDQNSIHRDIKPANIMVHRQTQVYYLLDFGAVKQIKSATEPQPRISTGIFTLGYAAPEQLRSGGIYPATDIYGLGATAVFLLTGKDPTQLKDATDRLEWRSLVPKVSNSLAKIIDRMLAPSLEQRFSSAHQVLDAFPQLENAFKPSKITASELLDEPKIVKQNSFQPIVEGWANQFIQTMNGIPLQSYILGGFAFGFELGIWGILLLTRGFNLIGVIPSLLLLLGVLLGLLYLRTQGILDNKDLLAANVMTFAFVLILKLIFRSGFATPTIGDLLAVSLILGFSLVAVLVMFRLIYQVLRKLL